MVDPGGRGGRRAGGHPGGAHARGCARACSGLISCLLQGVHHFRTWLLVLRATQRPSAPHPPPPTPPPTPHPPHSPTPTPVALQDWLATHGLEAAVAPRARPSMLATISQQQQEQRGGQPSAAASGQDGEPPPPPPSPPAKPELWDGQASYGSCLDFGLGSIVCPQGCTPPAHPPLQAAAARPSAAPCTARAASASSARTRGAVGAPGRACSARPLPPAWMQAAAPAARAQQRMPKTPLRQTKKVLALARMVPRHAQSSSSCMRSSSRGSRRGAASSRLRTRGGRGCATASAPTCGRCRSWPLPAPRRCRCAGVPVCVWDPEGAWLGCPVQAARRRLCKAA